MNIDTPTDYEELVRLSWLDRQASTER
jgi:hypothetical protein